MHLCLPGHKHTTQIFYDNVKSSDTSGFSIKNTYTVTQQNFHQITMNLSGITYFVSRIYNRIYLL